MRYEVRVTPELIVSCLVTGSEVAHRCIDGLPAGVVLAACYPVRPPQSPDIEYIALFFDDATGPVALTRLDPVYRRLETVPGISP